MKMSLVFSPSRVGRALRERLVTYVSQEIRGDFIAGLTVAVMGVPQAMAYALIAGLPPVYGLYTAIVTCVVAAVLGSSSHLVTGPTNALCMVILSLTLHLPAKYGVSLIECVFLLTFLTGLIQLSFGLLRLGGIVRYVSNSVVVGFMAGAGILIGANQLRNLFGLDLTGERLEIFFMVLAATFRHLPETNLHALFLGLLTAAAVILLPRIDRRLPGALIGVALTALLAFVFGWHRTDRGDGKIGIVGDIEEIRGDLSIAHIPELIASPNLQLTRELGAGAIALALLGLLEAASIARAIASTSGQRLDFNREFAGQGLGNVIGAFFSCFAGSGSFTRSAVCFRSGGKTRMAAVFAAIWTALTLVALGPMANYIPTASLAGILLVVAYAMVDKRRMALAWRSGRNSKMVLGGTVLATLVLPLEYAIFIGVFLSIVLFLRVTGKTDLTQLVARPEAGFDEVPFNRAAPSPVVTVNLEGDLYFAAVEDLDRELLRCLTARTRVVVLRMKRLRAVGSSAMAMMAHFKEVLRDRNITLVISGIEDELKLVMTGSGLRREIGEQNIFYADNHLFQSTDLALARAWNIVEMERRRQEATREPPARMEGDIPKAESLLSHRVIRFGSQHQLREAVWLMAEMRKRKPEMNPWTLFLQDREGRVTGELNLCTILHALVTPVPTEETGRMEKDELRDFIRESLEDPIEKMAETDFPRFEQEVSLGEMIASACQNRTDVIPIVNPENRLVGVVDDATLLSSLSRCLQLDPVTVMEELSTKPMGGA